MHNNEYALFDDFLMALGVIIVAQCVWIFCTGCISIHFITSFTIISFLWLCRQLLCMFGGM